MITKDAKVNFETLKRAFAVGAVGLIECRDQRTGKVVAVVATFSQCADGSEDITPFARLHDKEDLDNLQPPNPKGGFQDACEWEPT